MSFLKINQDYLNPGKRTVYKGAKSVRMRCLICSICLLFLVPLGAQSSPAEPVFSLSRALFSLEYFETQAQLWKAETEQNPSNASAWQYYYTSARNLYALQGSISAFYVRRDIVHWKCIIQRKGLNHRMLFRPLKLFPGMSQDTLVLTNRW